MGERVTGILVRLERFVVLVVVVVEFETLRMRRNSRLPFNDFESR